MTEKQKNLQDILEKAIDNKKIFGTTFCTSYKGNIWQGSSGNMQTDQPYFIASTTKLFITAITLNFQSKGLILLEDKIGKYLDKEILKDLHILNGKDFTKEITVKNLLAHTSGIPDYFQQKDKNGNSLEKELTSGKDQSWTADEAIERSKKLKPLFAPNTKGKAHYSDTNFQLLGKIIELLSGKKIADAIDELIVQPLQLTNTYLYQNENDTRPKLFYFKTTEMHLPKSMISFGPDGGIVSTSSDMLIFLKAFMNGFWFPKEEIEHLKVWNNIFFPMKSGIGIHLFKLPWIFNPFGTIPELIGHSGLSGALAYCNPEKELFITGTVNQVAYPDSSFKLAIKLIQKTMVK